MSGLREKKKKRTENKILKISKKLFEENGYETTTIEEIANECEIGVGTIYNYFKSKPDILVQILLNEVYKKLDNVYDNIESRYLTNVTKSILDLLRLQCNAFLSIKNTIWKELYTKTKDDLSTGLIKINNKALKQMTDLMQELSDKGYIKKDINIHDTTTIIASIFTIQFKNMIINNISLEDLLENINKQIKIIYEGLKP